jgi:eukaryotic-like serine/threonine-protein kinase
MRKIYTPLAVKAMSLDSLRVKTIFEQAIAVSDTLERRAWLDLACAGDEALRQDVASLVDAYESAGQFMQMPTVVMPTQPLLQGAGAHRFGDYELLEEIARGGMGVVYKARQVSLNRIVALKMILAGELATEAEVKRFRSEAQAAASLNHPNIVGIHEVGEHRGHHFYCMPFLQGRNLAELVKSGRWRAGDGTEAARLIAKLAHAVQYAHEAGILHRDIKPGNILIGADGEPCITDFGLAKQVKAEAHLTMTGHLLGTPSFMAPEQARGKSGQSTPATDIYSLGAVLYYLLTLNPPFVADSVLDALLLVLEGEAVLPRRINPLVPGVLQDICMRCLEKKPEDRYGSAGELALDLERFLKGDSLAGNPKAIGRRLEAWGKRQPAFAARLLTVLLCLGIVVTAYQVRHYETRAQYLAVIAVLVSWVCISFLCQKGVETERHATWVRFVWSGVDPIVLTAILLIAHAFSSPLVILYPTLIAASGFWFRASLVATTTGMSLLGYVGLLVDWSRRDAGTVPFHWHLLAFVGMIVTGLTVAYLVNRVNVLTRFYEHRPPAQR